jgi:hypothetical protein
VVAQIENNIGGKDVSPSSDSSVKHYPHFDNCERALQEIDED